MDISARITELAASLIKGPSLFLVDVAVSGNRPPKKVTVVIDDDTGATIEDCASLSRALSATLDEEGMMPENYVLEVTSPGVDSPLKLKRQYGKHLGRGLKVVLKDKSQLKGKFTGMTGEGIEMECEDKTDKKKKATKKMEIPFDMIDKALVQISFK